MSSLPGVQFVVPCLRPVDPSGHDTAVDGPSEPAGERLYDDGNARRPLTACDAALVKSGTSTLEAMLLHRPMVVSYRLGELTYQVVSRLLRTPYVALPNILAGKALVPELLQHEATPEALAEKLLVELYRAGRDDEYLAQFVKLHASLRQGANERAAAAVLEWLQASPDS